MRIPITQKGKPFPVPDHVVIEAPVTTRAEGFNKLPTVPLSLLGQDELDNLVALWLIGVYEKAGRPQPWELKQL